MPQYLQNAVRSRTKGLSLPVKFQVLQNWKRRDEFPCHVPFSFVTRGFCVRTIDTYSDFLKVLELRHRVFQKEFAGKKIVLRSDRDAYDRYADFIVVEDLMTNEIVGCYRAICSQFSSSFYSGSEFEISELRKSNSVSVELSRAAIHRDYRKGRVISLLWRGIATYMNMTGADQLFGCGSIQTLDEAEILGLCQYFEQNQLYAKDTFVKAKKKYRLKKSAACSRPSGEELSEQVEVPSLLKAYFKAGALVCSEPALDRKFRCTDFLVALDRKCLDATYREKYDVR